MKNILLIGAGRSSGVLIDYLLANAEKEDWHLTIGDKSEAAALAKGGGHPKVSAMMLDVTSDIQRVRAISNADLVISMLPASMHVPVAQDCIALSKPMVTASYISPEMEALDEDAADAGVLILNEIGLDPGIDHLSGKKLLDDIKASGGQMLLFESFAGGLVAPESDDNPWNYKFTWNPRNVVISGQGGAAKFIQEGKCKYIPYTNLFRRTEMIEIEGYGRFEGYANRDSLRYRDVYGLQDIPTIYRGTLRRPGFCKAWDVFVKLGATDDSYKMDDVSTMTHKDFINSFLAYNPHDSVKLKLMHYLNIPQDNDIMYKLEWLGIFEGEIIGLDEGTPAQILEHILMKKWEMAPEDKDMIVMWHKLGYELNGEKKMITSSMVVKGESAHKTAMAKTVGLPLGIAVKNILNGTIRVKGVKRPVDKNIYEPVLKELETLGISFTEKEVKPEFY